MKTKTKKVYYCEYCNKHGLSAGHMRRHEERCVKNPNRRCGFCHGPLDQDLLKEFSNRAEFTDYGAFVCWTGEPVTTKEILDKTDQCPACTLAILVQTGINDALIRSGSGDHFDYQETVKKWWDNINNEHDKMEMYGY
jgi:hypothetical protein